MARSLQNEFFVRDVQGNTAGIPAKKSFIIQDCGSYETRFSAKDGTAHGLSEEILDVLDEGSGFCYLCFSLEELPEDQGAVRRSKSPCTDCQTWVRPQYVSG